MDAMIRRLLLPGLAALLCQCTSVPPVFQEKDAEIVFALGSRDGFTSPMTAALKPACPALEFSKNRYALTGAHKKALQKLAAEWSAEKPRYLIAGYTSHDLPAGYARSLSERRAQAARQYLIEAGVEAASIQTVGFGHDSSPSGPGSNVAVVYRQPPSV